MKPETKVQMLILYALGNNMMPPDYRRADYEETFQQYSALFAECRVETMLMKLLIGQEWPWESDHCATAYEEYAVQKFWKDGFSMPSAMELGLMAQVANSYLRNGSLDKYKEWSRRALFEAAGLPRQQKHIAEAIASETEIDPDPLILEERTQTSKVRRGAILSLLGASTFMAVPILKNRDA